ncbi:MAG: porphobilinogen synthase, partial [Fibrobacteres bacterium]|nr:porphobilinogen synthase [Fibrobacterota bacterium]
PLRKRRLRKSAAIRDMFTETRLSISEFVVPIFVKESLKGKESIASMAGQFRFGLDVVADECTRLFDLGLKSVLLFGLPTKKDEHGTQASNSNGIIQQAVTKIKSAVPEMVVITDVCMCEYTSHGHCGIIKNGIVDNDLTLPELAKIAVSHAASGADIIAPSDMMDGRIAEIRKALDNNGFKDISIMSYAAKFSSSLYGPFREAAQSAPSFGDRKTYQMNPSNSREALHEALIDENEGADILMVKPALPYLDIISDLKKRTLLPVAAYQVSGEYAMITAASSNGVIDREKVIIETLTSIKRAGANLIITYFAEEAADILRGKSS